MKAVLLPIWPQYCALIANGKKTIEARKTRPKIETPFKCYIYCTQPKYPHEDFITIGAGTETARAFYGGGKVIGEFVCDVVYQRDYAIHDFDTITLEELSEFSCVSEDELLKYGDLRPLYGWHISDLVIYDKPKELSEFHRPCTPACNYSEECGGTNTTDCLFGISRPPQSWCYVEVI